MPPAEDLFEAVRAACSTRDWSGGVELVRAGAVVLRSDDGDRVVFQVSRPGGMIGRTVTLFPEDPDWDCPCAPAGRGCAHVAAAVIAWRRADETGEPVPAAGEREGRVGYRFRRDGGSLALERVLVRGETEHPLRSTLAAVASGRVAGPPFVATQADLAAELALGTHRSGVLGRPQVQAVLGKLAHCEDVTLDGRAVRTGAEPVLPLVLVEDHPAGFRLRVADDPRVEERFGNGIVLRDGVLRPAGEARLTGREREELSRGRAYAAEEVVRLVSEVLPDLRSRIPVEVRTAKLPEATRERPMVRVEVEREGETLVVHPALVYGDPPRARVVGGRLVHLGGALPARDEQEERRLARRLQHELRVSPGVRVEATGAEAVELAGRLDRWGGPIDGRAHHAFRLAPPLVPRLAADPQRFDVDFLSLPGEGAGRSGRAAGQADPRRVLAAWRAGESLVPLLEGGWAPIPADWLERFGHRLADLLAAREDTGALPACVLPDLGRLCDALDEPAPPEVARIRALVEAGRERPALALPPDVQADLRSYQREGVAWLGFLGEAGLGALLADDMGLGKTLQALCAVRGRTLVVAPTSVLHNWADEARRFRPGLRIALYHGPQRTLDPAAGLTLTTYAILRLDAERLAAEAWDTVVLDEAQAIKNPESQVATAAFALPARSRVALTGTPVENRLDELWSQFHFLNRGLLGGLRDFQERYAAPIAAGEPGAAARLHERIRPFLLRRLKGDVAPELPPRTEMVLRCELTAEERAVYDAIRLATMDEVVERLQAGGSVLAALELLLRLRQAACHPALVPGQHASGSSKLDLLLETLEEVASEGHKALVFSQWTRLLDLVEPELRERGLAHTRLDGSTRDRAAVVGRFQSADGPPVMLVSLKAGGTGLNLTAADHIFLVDPWWNPAVEDQAADRAHRIGQERPVLVYRLVAEGTVEERILELQARKREVAEAALEGADRAASITRGELLDLLS